MQHDIRGHRRNGRNVDDDAARVRDRRDEDRLRLQRGPACLAV